MTAVDGKQRKTDVINTRDLLRIIQSIPFPKAEPFKMWLAITGADPLSKSPPQKPEQLPKPQNKKSSVRSEQKKEYLIFFTLY